MRENVEIETICSFL